MFPYTQFQFAPKKMETLKKISEYCEKSFYAWLRWKSCIDKVEMSQNGMEMDLVNKSWLMWRMWPKHPLKPPLHRRDDKQHQTKTLAACGAMTRLHRSSNQCITQTRVPFCFRQCFEVWLDLICLLLLLQCFNGNWLLAQYLNKSTPYNVAYRWHFCYHVTLTLTVEVLSEPPLLGADRRSQLAAQH